MLRNLIAVSLLAVSGSICASETFDRALEAYEQSNYLVARQLLERAAASDHALAQEMLGMMYLYGPALYGDRLQQDRARALHWLAQAAGNGREVAKYMCGKLACGNAALASTQSPRTVGSPR